MTLRLYTHPSGLKHDMGAGHPECPARLETVLSLLNEKPFNTLPVIEAPEAEAEQITRAHPARYMMAIQDAIPEDGLTFIDGDTALCPHSWEATATAAGAVCQAVDDIMNGQTTRAFCAVRPPGHHAEPEQAMGFCFFNNIAVGALHALHQYNLERIVIVDFDVHHGNGTDTMARAHEGLFYISTHEGDIFPGTGNGTNNIENRVLNIPLPHGTGSPAFRRIYEDTVFPAIDAYAPDIIMISAGFDAHTDDALAGLNLTDDDYGWVTEKLCGLADDHCKGRIISALEGGYNLDALKRSVAAHLQALIQKNKKS